MKQKFSKVSTSLGQDYFSKKEAQQHLSLEIILNSRIRCKKGHFITFKMSTTLQEELNEKKKSFNKPITGDLDAQLVLCHRSRPLDLTKTKLVSFAKIFQKENCSSYKTLRHTHSYSWIF